VERILVGIDGSRDSETALARAVALAAATGATLHVAHVHHLPPYTELSGQMAATLEDADRAVDAIIEDQLTSITVPHEMHRVGPGRPSDMLIDLAASLEVDLIVVGTRGRSMPVRALLGSTAHELVSHAGCSVLIAR
jgi:nucleotide-binding universal stress UspA family protein